MNNWFSKVLSKFTGRNPDIGGTAVNGNDTWDGILQQNEDGSFTFNTDGLSREDIYNTFLARMCINRIAVECSKSTPQVLKPSKRIEFFVSKYPNEYQTISQFIYQLVTLLLADNNVYIVPLVNGYDQTDGLLVVPAKAASVVDFEGTLWLRYETGDGKTAVIEYSRCGHLSTMNRDNMFSGETNKPFMKTAVLYEKNLDRSMVAIKQSSSPIKWIAQLNAPLATTADIAHQHKLMSDNIRYAKKTGVMMVDGRFKEFDPYKEDVTLLKPDDIKQMEKAAYNYWGVSEKIMQNDFTEDEWNGFYQSRLEPILIQIGEVLTRMIYSRTQIIDGNGIHMNTERLQYASMKTRYEVSFGMSDRGQISVNESRNILNMPGIGPEGDKRYIRGEYYNSGEGKEDKEKDDDKRNAVQSDDAQHDNSDSEKN